MYNLVRVRRLQALRRGSSTGTSSAPCPGPRGRGDGDPRPGLPQRPVQGHGQGGGRCSSLRIGQDMSIL